MSKKIQVQDEKPFKVWCSSTRDGFSPFSSQFVHLPTGMVKTYCLHDTRGQPLLLFELFLIVTHFSTYMSLDGCGIIRIFINKMF